MSKRIIVSLSLFCFVISVIGCATIVSGRSQQLPIISYPSGATAIIGNMRQETPATFVLDRRQGIYQVTVEKDGYEPVTVVLRKGINGWVFGNIIFGGIIGLIIDISSGSASKFTPTEVEVNMIKERLGTRLKNRDVLIVKLNEEVK